MSHPSGGRFVRFAIAFELGLAAAAIAVGLPIGVDPIRDLDPTLRGAALGTAAALPLLPVLVLADRWPIRPFRRIRDVLDRFVLPILRGRPRYELALLAASAGIGEEVLFRGLIQAGLAEVTEGWAALAIASVIFGLVHAVTPAYAVLAGLMGAYFGVLYRASGDLTVPAVAHGVYDFVALIAFLRPSRAGTIDPGGPGDEGSFR